MKKYLKKAIHSPTENTLEVVGSKWTVLIIRELLVQVRRFGELEHSLTGISPRTLSLRLSALESGGIVERKVYPEVPPRVEYKLTPLGRTLEPILNAMEAWGEMFAKESKK